MTDAHGWRAHAPGVGRRGGGALSVNRAAPLSLSLSLFSPLSPTTGGGLPSTLARPVGAIRAGQEMFVPERVMRVYGGGGARRYCIGQHPFVFS